MLEKYRSNPLSIISFIFGHEGKGSLMSFLLEHQFVYELASGNSEISDLSTFFNIKLKLTTLGANNIYFILSVIFYFFDYCFKNGIPEYIFEEIRAINNLRFKFQQKQNELDKTVNLSHNMKYYPIKDILVLDYLQEEFQPLEYKNILQYMTPENSIITHVYD